MTNPVIQYSSRTFNTILADINSVDDLKDKPEWFKRLWAGVGDMLSLAINAQANNSYLETSFTDTATDRLLALIGYERLAKTTSYGVVLFYVKRTSVFPISLLATEQVAGSQGSISVSSLRFEGRSATTFASTSETFTADAGTDQLTVARSYYTGDLVRLSSTGTLPTASGGDLAEGTDYYAIYVSATRIRLARSLALALAGTYINITGAGTGTHTATLYSFPVTMYQQKSVDTATLGTSDGVTGFQVFDFPDKDVLGDTVSLTVSGDSYTLVESFIDSLPTDKHFKFGVKTDGTCYVMFGNGDGATMGYGLIPPNFPILVSYAYGGGANTNITIANKINSYSGGHSDIDFVSNPGYVNGGSDRESVSTAKKLAPILLKSRDRFVTVSDGEALTLAYGGISQVKIHKNAYGVGSCQVVIAPSGGGTPSSAFKTALQTYLINKTVLESIDVRVVDPVYITVDVTTNLKVRSGYSETQVQGYYELALSLIFSAATGLILDTYMSYGISSAVELINTTWSTAFTSSDYNQIQAILDAVEPVNFNDTIQESYVFGVTSGAIDGVEYSTISVPSFPIILGTDEITEIGTITTTVI